MLIAMTIANHEDLPLRAHDNGLVIRSGRSTTTTNPAKHVDWQDLGRFRIGGGGGGGGGAPTPTSPPSPSAPDDNCDDDRGTSVIELNTCMLEDLLATALEYDAHITNNNNGHAAENDHCNGLRQPPQDRVASSQHDKNGTSADDRLLGALPPPSSSSSSPPPQDIDDGNAAHRMSLTLSPLLRSQLKNYVTEIASRYHRVGFHSFDHASHVVLSATKFVYMLQRHSPFHNFLVRNGKKGGGGGMLDDDVVQKNDTVEHHDLTGTIYDPWLHFAIVFATLIHDVDHKGVPNNQLMAESDPIAAKYGGEECMKSYAEWNSVDIGLSLLRDQEEYTDLAAAIGGQHQKERFYNMVMDLVLCTDIACKERRDIGMQKWEKTVGSRIKESCSTTVSTNDSTAESSDGTLSGNESGVPELSPLSYTPEEVSVIAEQIIQAADVSHTMQHFSTFAKWNTHLYHEVLAAYNCGRTNTIATPDIRHPKENWYESQIGFFDFYVIPLAKRLDACGVFSNEQTFAQLAARNKEQWIEMGRECASTMVMEAEVMELPPPMPVFAHVKLAEGSSSREEEDVACVEITKLIKSEFDSRTSITEDTDAMSTQRSLETASRISRTEGASYSSRSRKSKWGRRASTSSYCSDVVDSSVNAIVPNVCVKQLIDSFQTQICDLPPSLRMNALRSAMSEYQSAGFIQRHRGALLFVDISGFTELSQKFNVEDFKNFINDYFTKIIELVNNFGGEVVKFAGDALIAIWISTIGGGDVGGCEMAQADASHSLNIEKCTSCAIAINAEVSKNSCLLLLPLLIVSTCNLSHHRTHAVQQLQSLQNIQDNSQSGTVRDEYNSC